MFPINRNEQPVVKYFNETIEQQRTIEMSSFAFILGNGNMLFNKKSYFLLKFLNTDKT